MKTNQIMIRQMGEFKVTQRTIDGKFDCTGLLAQWNNVNKNNQKKITEYLRLKETKEFVKALLEEPEFKGDNSHLLEVTDYKHFPKQIVVVTRGKKRGHMDDTSYVFRFCYVAKSCFQGKSIEICSGRDDSIP